MAQVMFRPTDDLKERITEKANEMGISINALLIMILHEYFHNKKGE